MKTPRWGSSKHATNLTLLRLRADRLQDLCHWRLDQVAACTQQWKKWDKKTRRDENGGGGRRQQQRRSSSHKTTRRRANNEHRTFAHLLLLEDPHARLDALGDFGLCKESQQAQADSARKIASTSLTRRNHETV
jgi:hypothetical protein